MGTTSRTLSWIAAAFAAAVLPACGDSGPSSVVGVGTITVTAFAPNPIPGGLPVHFTITGLNFQTTSGNTAIVRFHALNDLTPFAGGTSATAEVEGRVDNDTTIDGDSPAMQICGMASVSFEITVILESGVETTFAGGGVPLVATAPTVTSVSVPAFGSNIVPALVPTAIVINGTDFAAAGGPFGGSATVRMMGDSGAHCFADGTEATVELVGTITSATTITATSPRCTVPISGSGILAASLPFQGASVQVTIDANGACSAASGAAGAIQFDRPDGQLVMAGTSGPQSARQTLPNAFTITTVAPLTNVFHPAGGGTVNLTFIAGFGTPFQGGLAPSATVTGVLTSSTTITGTTPLAVSAVDFAAIVLVAFEDGTVGNGTLNAPVTFVAPPAITSFVNTRPPFQQGTPASFNANRCLGCVSTPVQVNGANFQLGAVADFYDTAVGPTKPIGTGLLTAPVVAAAQITGGSPTDTTLPAGLTQVTVRVTNPAPDSQVGTFTGAVYSTNDVLANVDASNEAGNNAEMNVAVNPTNPANAVVFSHSGTGGRMFSAFTTDSGVTWTTVLITSAVDGFDVGNPNRFVTDPNVGCDAFGNFYIAYLEGQFSGGNPVTGTTWRLLVLQSANGGATWPTVRVVDSIVVPGSGATLDRNEMGVGLARGGGATDQAVYVAYHDFVNNQIRVNGFRSTALGNLSAGSFGVTVVNNLVAPGSNNFHHPAAAVGPHGELCVSFIERNGNTAPTNIWMNVDPDGLGSATSGFAGQALVTTSNAPNNRITGPGGYPIPQPNRGYATVPSIDVIQTGPFVGRIVIAYDDKYTNDGFPGDQVNYGLRVLTRYSDSLGATWSSPVQAHVLDTRHQWQPWISSDPVTGACYVTWFDSIADAANNRAVQRFSAVSDDGAGWVNPLLLSQTATDVNGVSDGNDYLEYEGVAAYGGCVYANWNSFTAGNGDIFVGLFEQHP